MYLYHLFKNQCIDLKAGQKVFGKNLNSEMLKNIRIPLPPLEVQQKIVGEINEIENDIKKAKNRIKDIVLCLDNVDGKTDKFGKWLSLEYGKSLPERNRMYGRYPVVGSNGIVGYHNEYIVKAPCIVVGRKGSVGKITLIENDCFPIDTTFFLKWNSKEWNCVYLYYYLKTLNLENMKIGVGVPGINRNDIYDVNIMKPSLDTGGV